MLSSQWTQIPPNTREILDRYLTELPVKLGALAKELGIVVKGSTLSPGISGEIGPHADAEAGFQIRINRHDTKARQRFTLAHEIAHFLLHRDLIGAGVRDDMLFRSSLSNRVEAEANRLAADIIMPMTLVAEEEKKCVRDAEGIWLENLAKKFEVSTAAMKIRLGID